MWEHVSPRGMYVSPYPNVPTFNCDKDQDCNDGDSCTDDTCNAGKCNNSPRDDSCGNSACKAGELGSCTTDCGPFTLIAPRCTDTCWIPRGLMFDISTTAGAMGILVNGLTVRMCSASGNVSADVAIYTASGPYDNIYNNPESWTEIYSGRIDSPCKCRILARLSMFIFIYSYIYGQVCILSGIDMVRC